MKGQQHLVFQYRILIGSCLMALLSFPFFSHSVVQYVRKQMIRKEVKSRIMRGIPDNQLVHFHFHLSEMAEKIHWVEENEFEMGGHMYDVVHVQAAKDSIFFTCWPDDEESAIRSLWKEQALLALHRDPQKQQHRKKVLEFEKSLFFVSEKSDTLPGDRDYYSLIVENPTAPVGVIPAQPEPPPRITG